MLTNESNQLPLLRVLQTLSCATLSLKRRGVYFPSARVLFVCWREGGDRWIVGSESALGMVRW